MGSDRAHDPFDEGRQYRRVVHQQGRVVLEADINEAQQIFTEEIREELLEVVGPYGVPCDPADRRRPGTGFDIRVDDAASRDFAIGVGSLYVGGLRIRQNDAKLRYGNQSDWLDGPHPSPAQIRAASDKRELIYLHLREQEVSAIEDPTLLDPALGGPDTAQRVRLVRRVQRAPVASHVDWERQIPLGPGIVVAPGQMRLMRTARLQVGFDPATNAYVGPENQMIRIQGAIAPANGPAVATQLLWAYDNASALYSVKVADPKDLATLTLITVPVDANHQPRVNQYAEVLQASVDLGAGACVASPTDPVIKIVRAYDPNAQTIGLETALPAQYATAQHLFVRVWENSIAASSVVGASVGLIDANGNATGLQIRLSSETPTSASVVPGDYWYFTVRPATPTSIYPARYAHPQPPEGPREWACPLAIIDWSDDDKAVADDRAGVFDLRPAFGSLTSIPDSAEAGTISIRPEQLADATFQSLIDAAARDGGPVTIDLMPGRYAIDAPIALGRRHANLTIQAVRGRAELAAAEFEPARFSRGLMHLDGADGVTLRGLDFELPEAVFGHAISAELVEFDRGTHTERIVRELHTIRLSAGLRLGDCANLTLEHCRFDFAHGRAGRHQMIVFGGCILATGMVSGLSVQNCTFRAHDLNRNEGSHLLFGYLHAPHAGDASAMLSRATAEPEIIFTQAGPETHRASLTDATFRGNSFHGLTAAVLIHGNAGQLRHEANQVSDSYGGFWIFALNGLPVELTAGGSRERILAPVPRDPALYWALALTRCLRPSRQPRQHDGRPWAFHCQFRDNTADVMSTALIVWHAEGDGGGSSIVNANRLASAMATKPTGAMVGVALASVTGNVLVNHARETGDQFAVAFVAGHGKTPCQFASSGNAHQGSMLFPSEEDPGPTIRRRQ